MRLLDISNLSNNPEGTKVTPLYAESNVTIPAPSESGTFNIIFFARPDATYAPGMMTITVQATSAEKLVSAGNYYFYVTGNATNVANAAFGFVNGFTNRVEYWMRDISGSDNAVNIVLINPATTDFHALFPEFYEDEDSNIDPPNEDP